MTHATADKTVSTMSCVGSPWSMGAITSSPGGALGQELSCQYKSCSPWHTFCSLCS